MSCCHRDPYLHMFDAAKAREDLNDYLKTGYKKSSRPIFKLLDQVPVEGRSLLDIGGGIGAIPFELFDRGLDRATHNDISPAYIHEFLAESRKRQLQDRVTSFEGDFTEHHTKMSTADIVTLDKVICCYPEYQRLVATSSDKAKHWYLINLPREHWLVRIGMRVDYYIERWRSGKAFPTYFHPVSKIVDQLQQAGFRKVEQVFQREWTGLLFERVNFS